MSEEPIEEIEQLESAGVRATLVEYLHACPICHHPELDHYCRVPSLFNPGEYIHYERCGDCGTVLRNPRLPAKYRLSRYEDIILPEKSKKLWPRRQIHYAYMMRLVRRHWPDDAPGERLFDFGCGAGGFLLEARKAGFEVMGLELNKDLARFVEETHEIPVYQGLIDDEAFAGERFNAIVTSQVFEHLLDPRQTLVDLRAHLEPPGMILIEVPNLRAIKERLKRGSTMNDSHLFYFSAASLSRMFEAEGFKVLAVQEGLRLYRLLEGAAEKPPSALLELGTQVTSLLQIKTGLSVLARLA